MKFNTVFLSAALSVLLTACGGGDDSGNTTNGDSTSLLKYSQSVNYPKTYDTSNKLTAGIVMNTSLIYRWNVERDGLIPVVYSNRKAEFDAGFDAIEAAVGKTLFDRLTFVGKTSADIPVTQRAMIVGEYQTLVAAPTCGLVTSLWIDQSNSVIPPYPQSWSTNINNLPVPVGNYPINKVTVTVNFNPLSGCANSSDLVIHEVAHALGLNGHFEGFGSGPMNSATVLNVLTKLYNNSVGTPFSTLQ